MAAELSAVLEVLSDDSLSFHVFAEEEDDLPMFSMAAILARRNLNRCLRYFEQTVPFYSVDEFQSHFRLKRSTFEVLVREVVGTGALPVGNVFGRHIIDERKQVSIFDAMFFGKIPMKSLFQLLKLEIHCEDYLSLSSSSAVHI